MLHWFLLMVIMLRLTALPQQAAPVAADPDRPPAAIYHVPFRLDETQHLAVRAKIDGKGPFNFIIDTGAPAVFLSKDVAARNGIKPDAHGWATFARLEVEGGAIAEQVQARIEEPFQLQGMNALGMASEHIDGIFGYNLLARFRIQIDMTQNKLLWTPTELMPELPTEIDKLTAEQQALIKKAAKGQDQMEGLAKMATTMLAKPGATPTVRRGFFGMELEDTAGGPRILKLLPDSPVARAGLKSGDLIVKLVPPNADGAAVHSSAEVLNAASTIAAGDTVIFVLRRGGQRIKLYVKAGKEGL